MVGTDLVPADRVLTETSRIAYAPKGRVPSPLVPLDTYTRMSSNSPPADYRTTWIEIQDVPITPLERQRKVRNSRVTDSVFVAIMIVVVLLLDRNDGAFANPLLVAATLAIVALFAFLIFLRSRNLARSPSMSRYPDAGRVGSTAETLVIRGWWGRLAIPWSSLSPPGFEPTRRGRRFRLDYCDGLGKPRQLHIGPRWMRAVLQLPNVPHWDLPLEFQSALDRELAQGTSLPRSSRNR